MSENEVQQLIELAENVAEVIQAYENVRLISHNDSDGITSAGIMCQALLRKNINFHTTIVSRLNEEVVEDVNNSSQDGDLVIFCDMGSGQPELIENVVQDCVVIDHHKPVGESPAKATINPHIVGIEGATYLSASGTTYMVARAIDPDNIDLAGLAITGAVGDKQLFGSANQFILEEALDSGVVSINKGLKIGNGDLAEVLEHTYEPYLDIIGDRGKVNDFLDILDIHGEINELSQEDIKKLTSAIALKLAKNASPEAIDAAIGDVYILNRELVNNVYDLVSIINTCGKLKVGGLALSLCMKENSVLDECLSITKEHQKDIVCEIKKAEEQISQGKNIWYLNGKGMESTGIIASTVVRYIHPDMPFVSMNEVDDIIKVSSRGTRALISKGLDLSYAMREAAKAVGGSGGGHNIASGAAIPPGKAEDFINIVDDIIGEQLKEQEG